MRYKLFGHSGLRISELCLGTMTFGEDWGWGASKDVCRQMFEKFAEAGGNFIDTANKYINGSSEQILGELMGKERERLIACYAPIYEGFCQRRDYFFSTLLDKLDIFQRYSHSLSIL